MDNKHKTDDILQQASDRLRRLADKLIRRIAKKEGSLYGEEPSEDKHVEIDIDEYELSTCVSVEVTDPYTGDFLTERREATGVCLGANGSLTVQLAPLDFDDQPQRDKLEMDGFEDLDINAQAAVVRSLEDILNIHYQKKTKTT